VGYDSNRVIDDSTNDKIGILSHEGTDATDRPYQGACDRQSLPSGVRTRENVQNEANPESTQSSLPLVVESHSTEPAGRKRSQSAAGGAVPHAEESGGWPVKTEWPVKAEWPVAREQWPVASQCETAETAEIENRQDRHHLFSGIDGCRNSPFLWFGQWSPDPPRPL
jgi:hypothetical protein